MRTCNAELPVIRLFTILALGIALLLGHGVAPRASGPATACDTRVASADPAGPCPGCTCCAGAADCPCCEAPAEQQPLQEPTLPRDPSRSTTLLDHSFPGSAALMTLPACSAEIAPPIASVLPRQRALPRAALCVWRT
ncbi:MAG: hypothetical protein ACT4PL_10800 [Phycisphaerales bacterium]